ncbi:hypothetical protein [Ferrovibrio sp.]|uniref:hypothetical protein n=1 Tax=Ferrovibrio sp. TaxID=1917215 RepID=UPI0025BAFF01|nr:hypothetical protein [Ferrovibrio sp.]MBX3455250.1 hypothetical protein [Ferrovibrio sp.]
MSIAISAAPHIDTSALVKKLAGESKLDLVADPTPALVRAYGFQTLYDMPLPLQTDIRKRLITEHKAALVGKPALFEHAVFPWLADWMRWHWGQTPAEAWEEIIALGKACAASYGRIVHVADGPRKGYDGYAWLDVRNGKQIDILLHQLYAQLGVTDKVEIVTL